MSGLAADVQYPFARLDQTPQQPPQAPVVIPVAPDPSASLRRHRSLMLAVALIQPFEGIRTESRLYLGLAIIHRDTGFGCGLTGHRGSGRFAHQPFQPAFRDL